MENLKGALEEVELKGERMRLLPAEKPLYEGLRKIEDKVYDGGTSIRYWM